AIGASRQAHPIQDLYRPPWVVLVFSHARIDDGELRRAWRDETVCDRGEAGLDTVGQLLAVDGVGERLAERDVADDRRIGRQELREERYQIASLGRLEMPLFPLVAQVDAPIDGEAAVQGELHGTGQQVRGDGARIGDKAHLDLIDLRPAETVAV